MKRVFAFVLIALAVAGGNNYAQTAASAASGGQPVVLDHVVAVINGDVLLQSDVDEEMHFAALEPSQSGAGKDTRQDAMSRLVNRTLILQQMREQQFNPNLSDAEVEKSLKDERVRLAGCGRYSCTTAEGWNAFLAANDLTNQEVIDHWRERMAILRFIDQHFQNGIRISQASIADYYAKSVVPAFEQRNETAPPLKDVSARIQEVLLQQQVNGMLQDWLNSLREEGSVQILDPAYASATGPDSDSKTGSEE
jgi:peptidyl-prolyl cis-trans isomerase SurA